MEPRNAILTAISVVGNRFVDEEGRQVILHGINLVNKDSHRNYLGDEGAAEFAAMRRWGLNCVRLGVIWDGLEPSPGVIDEAYLRGIDRQIALAKENGLYIILDMHQDLYSVLFSDGAPAWATITDDSPHISQGGVWSDAYFTSPAVQTALDHFWQNAPAPDGMGLQEHYAANWKVLAERYASETAVIGYDLMNEPFPGSAALSSQMMLFHRGAELFAEIDPDTSFSAEGLAMQWLDPEGRFDLLIRLSDPDRYALIIDVTYPIYAEFERGVLMPFYRRVAGAIRGVDHNHVIFLETSMGSNMGVYSAIEPLQFNGQVDPYQAYAPHGYDLVVDTPYIGSSNAARVELIFRRHGETAARMGLPMLVGEWGAFDPAIPGTLEAAWQVSCQFERLLCSDIYWHFGSELDRQPPFQAISRPYPERVAGKLVSYRYDREKDTFDCVWDEDAHISSSTLIYLPGWFQPEKRKLNLIPAETQPALIGSGQGGWLVIPPLRQSLRRHLKIE